MKRQVALLTLLYLFTLFLPCSVHAGQQYEGKLTSDISIVVHKLPSEDHFDKEAVILRLKTKSGEQFSQITFDGDLKALAEEYDRVEPTLISEEDHLHITLDIWLKPTIRSITWEGNEKIKSSKLKSQLGVAEKSTFDRPGFNKGFHKVKAYYVKKGFFEAELDYQIKPDADDNEVDIVINVKEGRSGLINDITFEGLTKDEESDILSQIVTKKYNLFTSWVTGAGTYHDEAIEQDKLVIANYLQNNGFADAKVNIEVQESKKSNRIAILISADKGSLYTVGKLTFENNTLFDDAAILSRFAIYKNAPYSPELIRETANNITEMYGAKGYIDAYVIFEPHLSPSKSKYDVHFKIYEGNEYRVGMIKIFGNTSTQSRVILHESLLIPGDVFDVRKLKGTEERLHLIGYFKNVNVYWVKSSENESFGSNFRDVHIEVEEASTGSFSFAFGISTLESVFGSIEVQEKNFNYKGLAKIFSEGPGAMRGDGEYARARLNVGKKHRNMLLSWTKPYFMDTPWVVGFNVEKVNNRQQSNEYTIDSLGFSTHASYPINSFVRFEWQYRLRDIDIDVSDSASQSLKNEKNNSGIVSATGVALHYDSTDHPYKPRNGFNSRLDLEYAGLGGDHNFMGLSYVNSYYTELHSSGVFKYRADLKFIHPLGSTTPDTLPLAERLFLGGETTVRGYRGYSIGPRYSDNKNPRGGISSLLLSLEYLQNITDRVDAFTFLDFGQVSDNKYTIERMRSSYGYGLRLEVFKNMPIILGMGYPVNPEHKDDIRRFFFSIGGRF